MAWTATLVDIAPRDNHIALSIVYSDPTKKTTREYIVNDGSVPAVKKIAIAEVDALENSDVASTKLAPLGPIDLTPPPPPDPDPDVVAKQKFLSDWYLLLSYDRAVSHGLVAPTDPTLLDLEANVASQFLPSYIKDM